MDIAHHLPEPTGTEQQRDETHRRMLDRLAALAMEVAEVIVADLQAGADRADGVIMFEKVSRSVRRSILLCQQVGEISRRRTLAFPEPFAGRAATVRPVGDAGGPAAADDGADREPPERLDPPEFEDELARRPIEALIEEISHDLGLHDPGNERLWKRRVPRDLRALWEREAAKCRVEAVAFERRPDG